MQSATILCSLRLPLILWIFQFWLVSFCFPLTHTLLSLSLCFFFSVSFNLLVCLLMAVVMHFLDGALHQENFNCIFLFCLLKRRKWVIKNMEIHKQFSTNAMHIVWRGKTLWKTSAELKKCRWEFGPYLHSVIPLVSALGFIHFST